MSRRLAGALALVALAASGCGGRTLKAAGEACSGSSECEAGLLCDFGQDVPVCAGMSTVADAGPPAPDADPAMPDATPDGPAATPDADPPDAGTPDAGTPDAMP